MSVWRFSEGSDAAMFSIRHLRTNEGFIKAGADYAKQPRPWPKHQWTNKVNNVPHLGDLNINFTAKK